MIEQSRIGTEFRSHEATNELGLSEKERVVWTDLTEFARVNKDVQRYTEIEEQETLQRLQQLEQLGLRKILHVITSPVTADSVRRAIPKTLRPYIEEMYLQIDDRKVPILPEFAENTIHIDLDGTIEKTAREKMMRLLKDRVGIFVGGGPGYPTDASRKPFLDALGEALQAGTPGSGVCLGHQDFGYLAGFKLIHGVADTGPQVEQITQEGNQHPVYSRMGEKMGAMMFNSLVVIPGESAQVLTQGISTGMSGLAIDHGGFEYPHQVFTTQTHPELEVGTSYPGKRKTTSDEMLPVGEAHIIIPAGVTENMAKVAKYAIGMWNTFGDRIGMTPVDLQNILHAARQYRTLGKDFYGPMIDWMAKTAEKNLDKRKSNEV